MRAHDVRRLRVCDVCKGLKDKDSIITGYGAELCGKCSVTRAGGIVAFTNMYPREEWGKLSLDDIGAEAMKTLLARARGK